MAMQLVHIIAEWLNPLLGKGFRGHTYHIHTVGAGGEGRRVVSRRVTPVHATSHHATPCHETRHLLTLIITHPHPTYLTQGRPGVRRPARYDLVIRIPPTNPLHRGYSRGAGGRQMAPDARVRPRGLPDGPGGRCPDAARQRLKLSRWLVPSPPWAQSSPLPRSKPLRYDLESAGHTPPHLPHQSPPKAPPSAAPAAAAPPAAESRSSRRSGVEGSSSKVSISSPDVD